MTVSGPVPAVPSAPDRDRAHRRAKPWERERDRDVLTLCFAEWEALPTPKPDLTTWLHGASTALLLLRQVSS